MNLSTFIVRLFRFCVSLTFFSTLYFIVNTNDNRFINENSLQSVLFSDQQQLLRKSNRRHSDRQNVVGKDKKWIVITTISSPTKDIREMARLDDWNIVIVGDKKTPKDWRYKNCTFLDVDRQITLNYEILKYTPYNNYMRKMIGYLYAIEHGAKFIYDTDDDNLPIRKKLDAFEYSSDTSGIIYLGSRTTEKPKFFNVYSHFGRSDTWPRGYPLEFINEETKRNFRLCTRFKTPIIQQGLVDQDSDVDAIFRMIFVRNKTEGLNVIFDPITPPVILSGNSYCPFNSQNTLFHYDAFWSLLLPVTVTARVTDIWRSYWSQRLLRLINGTIGFLGSNARQNRNPHSYFKDFLSEYRLYTESANLVSRIHRWKCQSNDFSKCIIELSKFMADNGYWGNEDYQLTKAWVNDLKRLDYKFPIMPLDTNTSEPSTFNETCNNVDYVSQNDKQIRPESVQLQSLKTFSQWCHPFLLSKLQYSGFSDSVYDHTKNVILIITFNHRHFEQISLLQYLYDPWFANVVYCASFPDKFFNKKFKKLMHHKSTFSYINLTQEELLNGYFGYTCLKKIADMQVFNADGYLVISDDMLLNFWNPYDLSKVHLHNACEKVGHKGNGWQWWNSTYGELALLNLRQSLMNETLKLDVELLSTLSEILMIPIWCASDIYYVPRQHLRSYQILSELFSKHEVFLEIAVPKILAVLGWANRYKQIYAGRRKDTDFEGKYLWELKERGNPFNFYDKNNIFMHPIKMSLFDQPAWRSGFCNTYVIALFEAVSKRGSSGSVKN